MQQNHSNNKADEIKNFYSKHHDKILEKRFDSNFKIRKLAHHDQYQTIIDHIKQGESVLDAGCGEGMIGLLLAERNIEYTGVDLSESNIEAAKKIIREKDLTQSIVYIVGDAESLPFNDNAFDVVVSSHVLEHLPDFDKGWQELCRVARKKIIVALPTCFNPCAWALLGGDHGYWSLSKRSLYALPLGLARVLYNIFGEGVQEGYAGKEEMPHIWRYPWVVKKRLKHHGWKLVAYEASSICLPYCNWSVPLIRLLNRFKHTVILRYFGYGSTLVFEKCEQ